MSMMGGTSGTFYTQFGITMAAAVGILGCAVAALAVMMNTTKTGLLPEEDMGQVMVNITMPPGSSLAQTSAAIRELEKRIDSIPEMAVASATAGYGLIGGAGPSSGMIMGQLTDWSERKGEGQGIDDVLAKVYGPESLFRFNLYSAMGINGEAAQGYSSGDAINAIRETADKVLPRGYSFEFAGLSREESQTTNNTAIIFLICTVFVYLILCGLYESFFVPFSVILAVPFGLMGSFLFAKLMGLENNIYMQTGLIMLIGLLSKTAILLTEYASERRRAGMSIVQAALAAAKVRLRPILMTILAMIFGLFHIQALFPSGYRCGGGFTLWSGCDGGRHRFHRRPLRLLSRYYAERFRRVDEQCRQRHLKPGELAVECPRLAYAAPVQPGPEHRQPAHCQGTVGRSPAQFPSEPAEGRK